MKRQQLRQDWLSGYFSGVPFDLTTASADASFRSYYRVATPHGNYILMDAPTEHEDCRPFIHVLKLLARQDIHVPQLYAQDLAVGLLLLEDLGDELLLDVLNDDNVFTLYGQAIDSLIKIQSTTPSEHIPPYDLALLNQEMALFVDWFLGKHLGITLNDSQQHTINSAFSLLADNALSQPQVLVHRDFHSRNLMRTAAGDIGVLDFQDAVTGACTYDMVSLLKDCYISWPNQVVASLLERFRSAYNQQFNQQITPQQLTRWFDLMGAQRHLKAIGIFCRLNYRDGKKGYLNDIPRTMNYLRDTAAKYEELHAFGTILEDVLPVLADST